MKIIYLHQYFLTPQQGGAIRSWHLAKALVEAGHQVEMITAHKEKKYFFIEMDGIQVHYLPVYYDNRLGFRRRIFSFIRFCWLAWRKMSQIKNADLCYATSTPLTVGILALLQKKLRSLPYIFEVRDLWPLVPVELGFIRFPLLKSFLFYLEKKIYQNAREIVALSPDQCAYIQALSPEKKVHLIPNMSDTDFFFSEKKSPVLEEKFDAKGRLVISYFGALGFANHLEYLVDLAEMLGKNDFDKALFLVAGDGACRKVIQEYAKEKKLQNFRLLPHLNRLEMKQLLNITDIAYLSYLQHPVLETGSPNKFFDALAAGKALCCNFGGWIRELIEENECGIYLSPDDPKSAANKIIHLLQQPELIENYKKNAFRLAQTHFEKKDLCQKFTGLFK